MPKVSDYELEHFDDDRFEQNKREKRKKPVKEKKYSDKKDLAKMKGLSYCRTRNCQF